MALGRYLYSRGEQVEIDLGVGMAPGIQRGRRNDQKKE